MNEKKVKPELTKYKYFFYFNISWSKIIVKKHCQAKFADKIPHISLLKILPIVIDIAEIIKKSYFVLCVCAFSSLQWEPMLMKKFNKSFFFISWNVDFVTNIYIFF